MTLTAERVKGILQDSKRASGPALRTFDKIADKWELKPGERLALLGLPRSTYFKYLKEPGAARLSQDTLERISYVLGIYKALQILLPRKDAANKWVKQPNKAAEFKGSSPLALMLGGKVANLYHVRRYLDGQRGW